MRLWYKLLTYLFYPFANLYLIFRKLNKKEDPKRYKEKLSKTNLKREKGFLIWFHVASVGEAVSILPLIESLSQNEKISKILITSVTVSSSQILINLLNKNTKIIHQFFPFDVPIFINNFLNHWSPNLIIFVDSEIWPNFILKISDKKIPLLLLNARISKKTFSRWRFIKRFSQKIFEKFDLCIASNRETENYLKILGAKETKYHGNLKFSQIKSDQIEAFNDDFLIKLKNRKIWCAASTHKSEEMLCAKAHLNLKIKYKNILTIIIPRHVDRTKSIFEELSNLKLNVALYSKVQQINDSTDILLVDSYGQTLKFYNFVNCVFLGKSSINHLKNDSGQNPIEAARLGCKIFHGPYVSNFKEVYEHLNSLNVTKKITSYEDLSESVDKEFGENLKIDTNIVKKIEDYGLNILNSILEEIKTYIKI